jgi:uncharacterized protein (TIGR02145 family)
MKNALSLVCMSLAGILMPTTSFAQSNTLFNPDYNGDGFIGVDDILGALSFYDNVWDGPVANVIYGCTYPLFADYDASANVDDGSCATLAVLGCTDSSYLEYDCSANVDDGSCATLLVLGCTDSLYLEYDASANVDDGSCLTFICGNNVTYQGYDYATVQIGEQCWFAENLRSENYENGDAIPSNLSNNEWSSTTLGAVAVYGEGSSECNSYSPDGDSCDEVWSLTEYGRLYNFYAVDDARGLCPSGWHVPTDGEWTILTDHLGGESVAGGQMKTTYGWENGGNGTNSSGFSGLPGGGRAHNDGYFGDAGSYGYWWSSSPSGSNAWVRLLESNYEDVLRGNVNPRYGFSVRCVRDAE